MRLLLCYFATHPGRLEPSHQERWASVAHLSQSDMHNICNIQYLGVELQKAKKSSMFSFKRRKANKALRQERSTDTRALDCGRFQPLIVDTFNEFVTSKLPTGPGKEFDIVPGNSEFDAIPQAANALGAKSVRTSNRPQPTWHRRAGSTGIGSASLDDVALRSRKVVRPLSSPALNQHPALSQHQLYYSYPQLRERQRPKLHTVHQHYSTVTLHPTPPCTPRQACIIYIAPTIGGNQQWPAPLSAKILPDHTWRRNIQTLV